jgi:S-(hydroxymethyl)glutathione dehydrogenase / alcohol dehydrogenase
MIKAAILRNKEKIEIHNFEIPHKLRGDQVLVKIKYAGICGSQIMEYLGKRGKDSYLPHGFGHEAVGAVEAIGKLVKKVKIGDEVILSWIKGRGLNFGGYTLNNKKNEQINFGPISAFSSHVIASENRVFLKPVKMNSLEAVLYGCAVPTGAGMVLNQLKNIKKNNKVCLIGVGGIGMATLLTLLQKTNKIYVIENNKLKINFLKKFNINLLPNNFKLKKYYNHFDFCIDTSGSAKMTEIGLNLIHSNGVVVFASHPAKGDNIKINPHDLIKGKKIYGSWGGCCKPDRDIKRIFKFFDYKNVFIENSKIKKYKLSQITLAFKDILNGKAHRAVIRF